MDIAPHTYIVQYPYIYSAISITVNINSFLKINETIKTYMIKTIDYKNFTALL